MSRPDYPRLAAELSDLLNLAAPPLAIAFTTQPPEGAPRYEAPLAEPSADGRTGKVPAGCVFWFKAVDRRFTTIAEDHANCSVGSVTHGFKRLEEVGDNEDVAALLESGWVSAEAVPDIPSVRDRPTYVTYSPLAEALEEPDVVFLRVNAKQAMVLSDACPEIRFEGKPQCHIIAIAKEQGQAAVSVGCMLSRVRTGMPNTEMTCAIPAQQLAETVERLSRACTADKTVAAYASEDASRFHSSSSG